MASAPAARRGTGETVVTGAAVASAYAGEPRRWCPGCCPASLPSPLSSVRCRLAKLRLRGDHSRLSTDLLTGDLAPPRRRATTPTRPPTAPAPLYLAIHGNPAIARAGGADRPGRLGPSMAPPPPRSPPAVVSMEQRNYKHIGVRGREHRGRGAADAASIEGHGTVRRGRCTPSRRPVRAVRRRHACSPTTARCACSAGRAASSAMASAPSSSRSESGGGVGAAAGAAGGLGP